MRYVKDKYGEDNVAQIGTFGTLQARAAIKDVGRVLGIPLTRVNEVTSMVPEELHITLEAALEKGDESCFECHDFGLKFCDTCHDQTPPSHLPAGQWRARHPDAARADTRACRTCHELAFCSKCHLSHEEGWIGRHPSLVQEQGTDSCWRCHSRSFCSFCHTDVLRGSSEAGPAQR